MKTPLTSLFNLRKMLKLNLLIMTSVSLIICSCKDTKKEQSTYKLPDEIPATAVHVDSATAAIGRYADYLITTFHLDNDSLKNAYLSTTPRAFLIHKSDLVGVLGGCEPDKNSPFPAARAYLGMNASNEMHLYITPTVLKTGAITIYDDTLLSTTSGVQYVYDLILPCPNTCDKNGSILDKAFTTPFK
jgi:hypothetical protein